MQSANLALSINLMRRLTAWKIPGHCRPLGWARYVS